MRDLTVDQCSCARPFTWKDCVNVKKQQGPGYTRANFVSSNKSVNKKRGANPSFKKSQSSKKPKCCLKGFQMLTKQTILFLAIKAGFH